MERYGDLDKVELYYVLQPYNIRGAGKENVLIAWSFEKEMIEAYLKMRNCKDLKVRKKSGLYGELLNELEEYVDEQVQIVFIDIPDPEHPRRAKKVAITATSSEMKVIEGEKASRGQAIVDYKTIQRDLYYLKPEYREALMLLYLDDCIMDLQGYPGTRRTSLLKFNELAIFVEMFAARLGD